MLTPSRILMLAIYAAAMAGAVWLLLSARAHVLRDLGTPQAQHQWEDFRAAERARQQRPGQVVQRKVPTSGEPPALVLMRDHFAAVLAACLVLGSCLFWLVALMLRGAFRGGQPGPAPPGAAPPSA